MTKVLSSKVMPFTNELLIDSGAFRHCCPITFAPQCPVLKFTEIQLTKITASGQEMKCLGTKLVEFEVSAYML